MIKHYTDLNEFKADAGSKGLRLETKDSEHHAIKDEELVGIFDTDFNDGVIADSYEELESHAGAESEQVDNEIREFVNEGREKHSSEAGKDYTDYKQFIHDAEAAGLDVEIGGQGDAESGPSDSLGELYAQDKEGNMLGIFDQDTGEGILFETSEGFTEYCNTDHYEKEAGFVDDTVKNTIVYLRKNKNTLLNLLRSGGQNKLQQELAKIPAGGGSKGSLVTNQVEQWLNGTLNDNSLTDGLEKLLKQSSLGREEDGTDYDADGETDLNKMGEIHEDYDVKVGDKVSDWTPEVENDVDTVEAVYNNGATEEMVIKSSNGKYYGMNREDAYFMEFIEGHVPEWVIKAEEKKGQRFNDKDREILKNMGIQGKKRASQKTAAPKIIGVSQQIESVLKDLILGPVRDVMQRLGTSVETKAIKDTYFELDSALHKALKQAQVGSKLIADNISRIKESAVKHVEVVEKESSKQAGLEDLNDYAHDIVEAVFVDHQPSEVRRWCGGNSRLLQSIVGQYIKTLFPESNFEPDSTEYAHVRDMAITGIKNYFEAGGYDEQGVSAPKRAPFKEDDEVVDNLQFDDKDKDVLKSMGIKGSFNKFNACMENGGLQHVVEVMAPTEIEGLVSELPNDYASYPELSSVKDLLVDALVKINEFEASKMASKFASCGNCEDCECDKEDHSHADAPDSNTAANVDTTEQGVDSFYSEHDAVYASLDSTKLMLEASKYASTVEIDAVTDAPTAEAFGDTVENAEAFLLEAADRFEDGTIADIQSALLAANYTIGVAQKAIENCLGPEALLVLSSPVSDLIK
jgi:hypothetical protein